MHSLRHSFASALILSGAPVTEVQTLLGHACPTITLRIYSHWFKAQDSVAVDKLSAMILGSKKSGQKVDKHGRRQGTATVKSA
jgi:integrase